MKINENLSKDEKLMCVCFAVFLLIIGFVLGMYVGGYVFLLLAKLDVSLLTFDTLLRVLPMYESKLIQFPIIVGATVLAALTIMPASLALLCTLFEFEDENVFGNAREITDRELEVSTLLSSSKYPEILIGKVASGRHQGKYLKFSGQQFMGLAAPTRSGKGVGFVIPNLLNYRDSVCVLDIKAENFLLTAGYRQQMGQEVFVFAPDGYRFSEEEYQKFKQTSNYLDLTKEEQKIFDQKYRDQEQTLSHRWNPLAYLSRSHAKRLGEIKDMAAILYPDDGGDNAIWNSMAASLFTGFVLYMLDMEQIIKKINKDIEAEQDISLKDFRDFLEPYPVNMAQMFALTGVASLADWMSGEILYWKERGFPLSDACTESFNRFTSLDPKTRGNIMQNFNQPLVVFEAESCRLATSANDFDFADLRKKRMSIYIVLNPSGIAKYSRLVNLFFSQLITVNTKVLPEHDETLKYQCLLMLDEFTSIGRVSIIEKSIAFTAGYNLRYMLIYQDDAQLESKHSYGEAGSRAIKSNLALEVIYPPKVVDKTAERISKTFGKKTIKVKSSSRNSGTWSATTSNSTSQQYQARDLYLPQEIVELGAKKYVGRNGHLKNQIIDIGINEIIIMEKVKPFVAHKIIYFDEPALLERKNIAMQNVPQIPILKDLNRYSVLRTTQKSIPVSSRDTAKTEKIEIKELINEMPHMADINQEELEDAESSKN